MAFPDIQTQVHGRRLGLGPNGELILRSPFNRKQEVIAASRTTLITSAQLLALNATPISVLPAPGTNLAYIVRKWAVRKPAGVAYAGIAAGEDLTLKYTDGAGAQAAGAIETTGFLDQTTEQIRLAGMAGAALGTPANLTPLANAAVVVQLLSGEIITGDSPIYMRVWYDLLDTAFST